MNAVIYLRYPFIRQFPGVFFYECLLYSCSLNFRNCDNRLFLRLLACTLINFKKVLFIHSCFLGNSIPGIFLIYLISRKRQKIFLFDFSDTAFYTGASFRQSYDLSRFKILFRNTWIAFHYCRNRCKVSLCHAIKSVTLLYCIKIRVVFFIGDIVFSKQQCLTLFYSGFTSWIEFEYGIYRNSIHSRYGIDSLASFHDMRQFMTIFLHFFIADFLSLCCILLGWVIYLHPLLERRNRLGIQLLQLIVVPAICTRDPE